MKRKLINMLALAVVALSCSTTTTTTSPDTAAATTDTITMTTTTDAAAMGSDTAAVVSVQTTATVPATITTTFSTRYPGATNVTWSPYDRVTIPIDWEMTGWSVLDTGDYVAEFDMDGKHYYAWYDASGKWIGSSSMLANHGDLPKAVRDLLVSKYNGYTIEKVEQEFDDARTVYEIKLRKGADDEVKLHVTEAGMVVKEKKKS